MVKLSGRPYGLERSFVSACITSPLSDEPSQSVWQTFAIFTQRQVFNERIPQETLEILSHRPLSIRTGSLHSSGAPPPPPSLRTVGQLRPLARQSREPPLLCGRGAAVAPSFAHGGAPPRDALRKLRDGLYSGVALLAALVRGRGRVRDWARDRPGGPPLAPSVCSLRLHGTGMHRPNFQYQTLYPYGSRGLA